MPVLTSTTVGRKAILAGTGIVLLGYVTLHMLANLKAFLGPDSLDSYARWLREVLAPVFGQEGFLWLVRGVLLVCVVTHLVVAVQLTRRAHAARPVGYRHRTPVHGSYAARTMRWGGVIIALFVVYHVLDLTAGVLNPAGVPGAPYRNVTADFQHWYVVAAYTVAVLALGFHLRHGVWSGLRSLGFAGVSRPVALGYAVVITVGFLSVPYAVLFGVIQ
ncbi:succinate dehydrogenase cytochrome b subunit [Actinophytocola sp.]|uniref:succinate dehydrogenase cytochrome b subunit n=1 Tax=Actinophytocola sp. TaxID=1872138 RepID=UPI002D7FAEB0|nr:succinate dehydrogenase cytochrome b subunit [Actinophytocola sp.]HET9141345.1 succinate dehydrogenase cytochrome b subunit [Actinophytocola sp.]HEU5109383.1 succinate dehydrogenase cytochrome b subunit [Micromonosporaceae bacterium]